MDIITLALAKKMINSRKDAYVFNSIEELQDFINSSKDSLKIGDKFYITDPNSPDYWWDGTTLQEEKVKIDLSNLATKEELNTKQNILTAGKNINIEGDTISALFEELNITTDGKGHAVISATNKQSELWTIGSNGNWFLGEVDTGLPSKGDTPKKGIDYFTEEDKQELVQEVITALPKYNGETSDKS